MKAIEIRNTFLEFFKNKAHTIVPSAPIVVKDDPTLMFTNAGMNQFKDYFLGNKDPKDKRVCDSQKCLRVSGKHNDLEEVGVDTYHHTMFEMLGNWSFGDYFKQEAIEWAWELLTEVYGISKDRIYVSVFSGDKKDNLPLDKDAKDIWSKLIDPNRILEFDRKDNFWEMGDTGPCGPCSEIHVDIRSDEDRAKVDGKSLVNMDHPEVIEIWNLVFIQFNRKADGKLVELADKHVDTGMGFERLCAVLQGKKSNYETDVSMPLIDKASEMTGVKYGTDEKSDIALRVIADHCRAISFAISDGQLPSNNGAGYVIRRILRRGVRYVYSVLNYKEPLLNQLIPVLAEQMAGIFPELKNSLDFVQKVVLEEENSFLKTLAQGLKRFEQIGEGDIDGKTAFELYDTYGFPLDLTMLLARENNISVDEKGFQVEMEKQRERARSATSMEAGDWTIISGSKDNEFIGYDYLECETVVNKFRTVKTKKKSLFQIVLDTTPFYAESGGQVGDRGTLKIGEQILKVLDTQKDNDLIVHLVDKLPENPNEKVFAKVNPKLRKLSMNNHTATHLVQKALEIVLGDHVEQKGSLVNEKGLRFYFSHFAKVEPEDLKKVEQLVNEKIRENIPLLEQRNVPIEEAKKMGAKALFGEKYGDFVRVITFDENFSRELCGGTHVKTTGEIGFCKIVTETSVAAGVRRVEAITGPQAYEWITSEIGKLNGIRSVFKNPKQVVERVQGLSEENAELKRELDKLYSKQAAQLKNDLKDKIEDLNDIKFLSASIEVGNADMVKKIAFDLQREVPNLVAVFGAKIKDKPFLTIIVDKGLTASKNINASTMIRAISKHIQGGGGGQDFYATAGGNNLAGIEEALKEAKSIISTNLTTEK